jgi:hypothetical protein
MEQYFLYGSKIHRRENVDNGVFEGEIISKEFE